MLQQNTRQKVVILGDSTIDNRVWLDLEPVQLLLGTRQHPYLNAAINHISRLNPFKSKSVIKNLRAQMPNINIIDQTNDGFTTADVLNGQYKHKVFGPNAHRFFPDQFFTPLESTDINDANQIILSVGGNNFREFILKALAHNHNLTRQNYINRHYDNVFSTLQAQYLAILKEITRRNPNAHIILMTQYYPAINQKMLTGTNIYDFMGELGAVRQKGDAENTIIEVMKDTYNGIIKAIAEDAALSQKNISIIDVTSSLNPNLSENFVGQIEPSHTGGAQIAKMLQHVIEQNSHESNKIYRFAPAFFQKQLQAHVYTSDITPETTFNPVRPSAMTKPLYMGKARVFSIVGTALLATTISFASLGLSGMILAALIGGYSIRRAARHWQIGYQTVNPQTYQFESAAPPRDVASENFGVEAAKAWLPYLKSALPFSGAHNNEDFDRGYEHTIKQQAKPGR